VTWEGGGTRARAVGTGTGPWYRLGADRVAVRWGDVHEGTGTQRDADGVTTALPLTPPPLVAYAPPRGALDTTGHASRTSLSRESPTGDGHATVRRRTPCLVG
jgi:hypothetical protein